MTHYDYTLTGDTAHFAVLRHKDKEWKDNQQAWDFTIVQWFHSEDIAVEAAEQYTQETGVETWVMERRAIAQSQPCLRKISR